MAQASSAQREPSMEEILASIRRIIEDSEAAQNDETNIVTEAPEPANEDAGAAAEVETFRDGLGTGHTALVRPAEGVGSGVSGTEEGRGFDSRMLGANHGYDAVEAAAAELPTGLPEEAAASAAGRDTMANDGDGGPEMPAGGGGADSETGDDAFTHEPRSSSTEPSPSAASGADNPPAIISEVAGRKVAAAFEELNEAFEANRRKSFDQVAEEMLRPMLQEWLDNNLPTLVERLVREEIERVARGGSQ